MKLIRRLMSSAGYCALLIPVSVRALARRRIGVGGVGLLLGVLALIPLGIEIVFVARGVLYGLVDRGPYDNSWGGASMAGAWAVHLLVSVPLAVAALFAQYGIAALHRRFAGGHGGRWVLPVIVLACLAGALLFVAWARQIRGGSGGHRRAVQAAETAGDEAAEHLLVDVGQSFEVEAGLAGGVRAEPGQQVLVAVEARREIQRQGLLARRQPDRRPVALAAGRVPVVIRPEPDDARPPHRRRRTGDVGHQGAGRLGVGPAARIGNGRQELGDTRGGAVGLRLSHRLSPRSHRGRSPR
jgi:hypothetical protein